MSQFILLHGARQLLTLQGPSGARRGSALHDLRLIEDGSVLIQDGNIFALGNTRRIENMKESRKAINIDVRGSIVMPGFVDASVTVSRDQRSLTQGSNKIKKPRQMYDDGLALMRSCLQHGTLTAEVKAGAEANDFRSDISVLRQLAKVGKNPVEMIRTWRVKRWPQQEQELRDFAGEHLAGFKVPRKFVFLSEIPKGATGKLQRIGLAEKLGLTQ